MPLNLPERKLGKLPARRDRRIPPLTKHLPTLAAPPQNVNWYAAVPLVPMLGNDKWGDCVPCTVCHYLQLAKKYVAPSGFLQATEDEALAIYSAVTGFNASAGPPGSNPTDQGTYMLGPGGMVEYWIKHGVTVGGKLDKLEAVAQVDVKNHTLMKQALWLFGALLVGAEIAEGDMEVEFMWQLGSRTGQILGGHEFLVVGYETLASGFTVWDIHTWDGHRRMTSDWMDAALDEAIIVYNDAFINSRGMTGAGVTKEALLEDMKAFA